MLDDFIDTLLSLALASVFLLVLSLVALVLLLFLGVLLGA